MSAYSVREYESDPEMDAFIRGLFKNLFYILRMFNSSILDMYTVTRMLKTPETKGNNQSIQKETQATLSLGFFGDSHIRKMVATLLSPPFHYELVYSDKGYSERDDKRCIKIDEMIPLVSDIEQHHSMRFNQNNTYSKSNAYYHRLRKEQRQRMSMKSTHRSSSKRSSSKRSSSRRSFTHKKKLMSLKKSHVKSMNKKENV
jgi:hypothetical protein